MRRGGRPSGSGTRRRARPEGRFILPKVGHPRSRLEARRPSPVGRPERGREGTRAPSGRPVASARRPCLSSYCTRRRPEALLLAAADVHRATAPAEGAVRPAPGPAPPRGACAPACVSLRGVHGGRERARPGAPDGCIRRRPGGLPGPCVVPGGLSPSISDGVVELLSFRARPSAVSSTVLLRAGAGYTGGPVRYVLYLPLGRQIVYMSLLPSLLLSVPFPKVPSSCSCLGVQRRPVPPAARRGRMFFVVPGPSYAQ